MNTVIIMGNMTSDVEIKYTASGTAIGSFSLAFNERWKDQAGEKKEKAHFFNCTAFGKTAENIQKFFHRGSRILVTGSLDHQTWTAQDGTKRSNVGIKISGFDFIDKSQQTQAQPQHPQPQMHPQNTGYQPQDPMQHPGGMELPGVAYDDEIPF